MMKKLWKKPCYLSNEKIVHVKVVVGLLMGLARQVAQHIVLEIKM